MRNRNRPVQIQEREQTMSTGQDLLDVANQSSDGAGGYEGPYFRGAVREAMKKDRPDKHTKKKRKLRKDEAATSVSHIFDNAKKQSVNRLDAIASEVPTGGPELNSFAEEVADTMNATEGHEGGFGILDPMTLISLITSIISTIVPLFQSCKKPAPTPAPVPTPSPTPTPTPAPVVVTPTK